MNKYIKLIRAKHYIKNILLFVPMVCARQITLENISFLLFGFLSFSFLSSSIYIINDIRDIDVDRMHPKKRERPLASGSVKISTAIYIMVFMLILAFICNTIANKFSLFNHSLVFLLVYAIINLAYSFGLKNVAILDIFLLASGFVFRIYYGASILAIDVSPWLFLTILSAAMFMGLGKRKKELIHTPTARKVLLEYNETFLDNFQNISLALVLVFYSLWTIQQNHAFLTFSIIPVMIILMRYCLIINRDSEGDPTTILFSDKALLILSAMYGIYMLTIFLL